jgi:hypothetical protein
MPADTDTASDAHTDTDTDTKRDDQDKAGSGSNRREHEPNSEQQCLPWGGGRSEGGGKSVEDNAVLKRPRAKGPASRGGLVEPAVLSSGEMFFIFVDVIYFFIFNSAWFLFMK